MSKKATLGLVIAITSIITILTLLPVSRVKHVFRAYFAQIELARSWLYGHSGVMVTFSFVQNILHVPFFAVLTFAAMKYLKKKGMPFFKAAVIAALLIFIFSAASELFQLFMRGRDASFSDLALDMIGCSIGIILVR